MRETIDQPPGRVKRRHKSAGPSLTVQRAARIAAQQLWLPLCDAVEVAQASDADDPGPMPGSVSKSAHRRSVDLISLLRWMGR